MADYGLPTYDKCREWMKAARDNGMEWDVILYGGKSDDAGLDSFLENQKSCNFWNPTISADDWKILVERQKAAEQNTMALEHARDDAIIVSDDQDNNLHVPTDPKSAWCLYRNRLTDNGFAPETVNTIEQKTISILRRLKRDNPIPGKAVKGLVIGNVQSGKTANMAALMAMAADWGWNMFIILSGTIDSLRCQTQSRLLSDLNTPGNLAWVGLEHLAPRNIPLNQRLQNLSFDPDSKERYFTVCLKNSTRLKGLIGWLQSDSKKAKQLRILVIDDEADQAGINTAIVDAKERKAVNKAIVNMIQNLTASGKEAAPYLSMNYIGYTATPYANILNESSEESLYPSSFIATLDVSNEYFGPQQIFGEEGNEGDGLNIIREISDAEISTVKEIHKGEICSVPDGLQSAICWFLCSAACFRVWKMRKPVSMLVHTSQKTVHHKEIARTIQDWFSSRTPDEIIGICRNVWNSETEQFDKDDLFTQYPVYARAREDVNEYPDFSELEPHLRMLTGNVQPIRMDDADETSLVYHDGVHLCIDNCMFTKVNDEGEHFRLAYPSADQMPELAPAFLVIGGATLSRGLTIEGLVSTYFVRSVSQADSLMQMGRWFGYRRKYELLPRIWMTEKTRSQFVFLASLDTELRNEIRFMETTNRQPRDYAPKVKNSPLASFIRLTAKNKMQMAVDAEYDYTGVMSQTTLFDDSYEIQKANYDCTLEFLRSLPEPVSGIRNPNQTGLLWKDIPFNRIIRPFLRKFRFQERSRAFADMEALGAWIQTMTDQGKLGNWNIKLGSLDESNGCRTGLAFPDFSSAVYKVTRSRKTKTQIEGLIDIGVLRAPRDMIADIEAVDDGMYERLRSFKSAEIRSIRYDAGMSTTPLMVLYCIDKDSKTSTAKSSKSTRMDLKAPYDLIGLCICLPGGEPDGSYVTKLQVRLKDDVFDGNSETEDDE